MIETRPCPTCSRHWAQYSVQKKRDAKWKELPDLTAATYTDAPLTP